MSVSSVNLILGPAKSGKTTRALERYCGYLEARQRDLSQDRAMWIGPTLSAINDVRDRLAQASERAWLDPGLATFAMLAEQIIAAGRRKIRVINGLEKFRVLQHIVGQLLDKKQLTHFTRVAGTNGFLRQAGATIADLKRRDIWAEDFRDAVHDDRDHDFSLIYSAYHAHLHERGLYDAEGRFWAAREVLSDEGASHRFNFGLIALDGFGDFTIAQHDLLRQLSQHSGELLLTLQADPNEQGQTQRAVLFDKPRRTLQLLEASFPQLHREPLTAIHFNGEGLAFVERNLFRDDAAAMAPTVSGLSIVAAESAQGEIRQIAIKIKRLLNEGVAQPEDVAVIFPRIDDVSVRVRDVFDDFGLPFIIEDFPSVAGTPFYRALSNLLEVHVQNWPFDVLLSVLGNRRFNLFAVDEENARAAIEHCIRRAQLPAGRTLLLEQLREWSGQPMDPIDGNIPVSSERARLTRDAANALAALEQLETRLAIWPDRGLLNEWISTTERLLQVLGLRSEADKACWQSLKVGLQRVLATDTQFHADDKKLSGEEFANLLQVVADSSTHRQLSDSTGRVLVLSAESARTLAVKHVFLAGLSEQSYSSASGSGHLYQEQALDSLSGQAQGISTQAQSLDLADRQVGETMLLFYDVATRASNTLTLSYSAFDDKGQTLTPSPFLTELIRCCEPSEIAKEDLRAGSLPASEHSPSSLSEWRLQGVAEAIEGKREWLAGLACEPSTKPIGKAILHNIGSIAARSDREAFGPFEGILASDAAREVLARRYDAEHLWSPSQLEKYAACPYQFFASQVLKLEPLDELALRSDHLRRGNLLHQVLVAVHEQPLEPGSQITDTELVSRFTSALERTIAETPLKGLADALREIERREIFAWAADYADQELQYRNRWPSLDEPFLPTHFEVRFGPKARGGGFSDAVSTLVPFTLDLGSEQIKLTGQIDRIDMGRVNGVTVFNIIDYKSGQEVKLADKEILAGRQLQLPLYALAAEKLLFADQRAMAFATGYWSIKAGGFATGRDGLLEIRTLASNQLADSERWTSLTQPIVDRVQEIVDGIRHAEFPVFNDNLKCTHYCEFSKICRIAQIRSLDKVWIAPDELTSQPDRHAIREQQS